MLIDSYKDIYFKLNTAFIITAVIFGNHKVIQNHYIFTEANIYWDFKISQFNYVEKWEIECLLLRLLVFLLVNMSAYIWVDVGDQVKYPENKVLK